MKYEDKIGICSNKKHYLRARRLIFNPTCDNKVFRGYSTLYLKDFHIIALQLCIHEIIFKEKIYYNKVNPIT